MKQRLQCKPVNCGGESQILYTRDFYEIGNISFRSLDLLTELKMIYEWVNKDYSKQFWRLHGSRTLVENTYRSIQQNPGSHSFIGLHNGKPVCQMDVYLVAFDELSDHVLAEDHDAGMHMHMAPLVKPVNGLSLICMRSFLDFYFSFPESKRMFGEPDEENLKANRLVERAGFQFLKPITMSYKRANLWVCTREELLKNSNI
jgi:RimJ/RimL family protein N-acetyltransferase